jgi:hypothetical protein
MTSEARQINRASLGFIIFPANVPLAERVQSPGGSWEVSKKTKQGIKMDIKLK